VVRRLFVEIQRLGYVGCYTYLARHVAAWRRRAERKGAPPSTAPSTTTRLPCHPDTGRRLSPQVAAALCLKPRHPLTARQGTAVDALKRSVADFTALRRMAMRFRGVLRGVMSANSTAGCGMHTRAAFTPCDASRVRYRATSTPSETPSPSRGVTAQPRPDQPSEDAQAQHGRPSRLRTPSRPHAPPPSRLLARRVRRT
jgi:hypothetical protein